MHRILPSKINRAPLLLLAAATAATAALSPTEWQHRQPLDVAQPGLVRVTLPPETFDLAQAGLRDLRVVDPAGLEVASALVHGRDPLEPAGRPRPVAARDFSATTGSRHTQVRFSTGIDGRLDYVELVTSAPYFLKAAHVEVSLNGVDWTSLGPAVPLFRQFGAENLRLEVGREAPHVRVTLDDERSRPIEFTGAHSLPQPGRAAGPERARLPARIERREEFAGETVLTVTLPAAHLPLAALFFECTDPLFIRRVSVTIRDVSDGMPRERPIGAGTIYRVDLDGTAARARLEVPVDFSPATRELLVHVHNGDSPPLQFTGVQAEHWPVRLHFVAARAGLHHLLVGNAQAQAPRYDLAALVGDLRQANAQVLAPGSPEVMPGYRPAAALGTQALPEIPLAGAPLDAARWRFRRAIDIRGAGVQELELDPAALAGARPDFADLRLLRARNQIPYVLEQPGLHRLITLPVSAREDPKRPRVSRWQLALPHAGTPVHSVILQSGTPLFQRQFRIYELRDSPTGGQAEHTLATGNWSRLPQPGEPETFTLKLSQRPATEALWLETDNGDNPAIALTNAAATYPVARLVFKASATDGFELAYGHTASSAPSYDLRLVADRLLTAPRVVARLASVAATSSGSGFARWLRGATGGYVFWGALALVVVVLLLVVARLLPKPPVR